MYRRLRLADALPEVYINSASSSAAGVASGVSSSGVLHSTAKRSTSAGIA